MNTYKEIKLEEVRSKNYDQTVKKIGEHSNTCFICGKKTKQTDHNTETMVHYTIDGNITLDPNDYREDSQGWFPVGPDCMKKVKKALSVCE